MDCGQFQTQVNSLTQQLLEKKTEAGQSSKSQRAELLLEIKELQAELVTARQTLADCLAQQQPPAPVVAAPREILEIQWTNPAPPNPKTFDWATQIVGGKGTFPRGADFEWLQVLDPSNEYDDDPVGASGWVIGPDRAKADFEFLHPFDKDFEFYLALDIPRPDHPDDPDYLTLVAPGNSVDVQQRQRATQLGIPARRHETIMLPDPGAIGTQEAPGSIRTPDPGSIKAPDPGPAAQGPDPDVLGVEMDGNLVPQDVANSFNEGSRVAVFGRWIIDTGHYYAVPPADAQLPDPGFRTEIHPPLLMAGANTQPSTTPTGVGEMTRVVLTSRPYLVGQTFTNNMDSIYKDEIDDDGPFYPHIKSEVTNVLADAALHLDAHPKIKSQPFRGAHLFHFIVRPPAPPPPPSHEIGLPVPTDARQLVISFHFTVRTGCSVEVTSEDGSAVNVFVAMNSVGYTPPLLPARTDVTVSREQLSQENQDAKNAFDKADLVSDLKFVLGPLGITLGSLDGIRSDAYPDLNDNVLSRGGAVVAASPANIPAGAGVTANDAQPYPVTGWLEVEWQDIPMTNLPTA